MNRQARRFSYQDPLERGISTAAKTGSILLIANLLFALAMHATMLSSSANAQPSPEQMEQLQGLKEAVESGQMTEEQAREIAEGIMGGAGRAMRVSPGGPPPNAQPARPANENGDEKKEEKKNEAKKEKKDDEKTVKRKNDGSKADPTELDVKPDKDGMVEFSFHGQPWEEVLRWYSSISKLSLDWQELPEDTLNLATQRKHTIEEARDLINSRLLARGFTMIRKGSLLTVSKIDKLDPSLIPRIEPDDLEDYMPHDFVRVRLNVPRAMEPAKAQEDAKILLSPNAKATPLLASRRLLLIDAVANLRDVRDLFYGEQLAADADIRPVEFKIKHRRADYVVEQVMIVMGMDPASRKTPQEMQLEQQRMQLMMQLAQQKKDVTKILSPDQPKVFFAVDRHTNTIMVNAGPHDLEIVTRSIKMFDVPYGGVSATAVSSQTADQGGALEFREYKPKSANTDAVVSALKEIGSLHPLTQLQSDPQTRTIFATATAADHDQIEALIKKLDGESRKLYPIQLSRRYRAIEVAGTVHALMVGEKKEDNSRRSRYSYYGYGSRYGQQEEKDEFRIQPDVEQNRLLLWATPEEYEEVISLLQNLGAISSSRTGIVSSASDQLRVLEARSPEETARLVERLRQVLGDDVEIVAPDVEETTDASSEETEEAKQTEEASDGEDKITQLRLAPFTAGERRTWLAQQGADSPAPVATPTFEGKSSAPSEAAAAPSATVKKPKVKIVITRDGRILLNSDDPLMLDRIEALIDELEPRRDDFEIFYIDHVDAWDIEYNLKEYFREELEGDDDGMSRGFFGYGGYGGGNNESTPDPTLGRARKLQFLYDPDSNSVLVKNASESQLKVIRKLVKLYDRPVKEDDVAQRKTEAIPIKYSRATDIATALKEAYRDLLSSKDKEFQNREGEQGRSSRPVYYRMSFGGSDDDNDRKSPVKVEFEGALAIGVDVVSNTLIVSAEANIFEDLKSIVKQLDEGANPETTVALYEVSGTVNSMALREALQSALSKPWTGGRPDQPASGANGGGNGGGDEGGEDRRRDRRR